MSTLTEIGKVEALFRYPVKSMAGERLEEAALGWHGLEGDRRLAFRRLNDRAGFPWLTASQLPDLLRCSPHRSRDDSPTDSPTQVRLPNGATLPLFSGELAATIGSQFGAPVEMTHFRNGLFDDAAVSVIATETVAEIGRLSAGGADVRRYRPNIVVRLTRPAPFQEDDWVGGSLVFGDSADAAVIAVTSRDLRCSMINLDPDSAEATPEVLKAVARANQSHAGVYATVTRRGQLAVGQSIFLHPTSRG